MAAKACSSQWRTPASACRPRTSRRSSTRSTRPRSTGSGWGCRSVSRSSRRTADGSGPPRTSAPAPRSNSSSRQVWNHEALCEVARVDRNVRRPRASKTVMLKGIGVSAGVAQGTAYVVADRLRSTVPQRRVRASEWDGERARFDAAVVRADAELLALQEEVRENIGPTQADIFGAQRLVLGDPFLREQVLRSAEEKRINVEAVVSEVFDEYIRSLEVARDGHLSARAADIHDVRKRLLSALAEQGGLAGPKIPEGAIVVSEELLPSVTDRLAADLKSSNEELRHLVDLSSVTLDGTTLPLLANVNKFSDTEAALLYNADGIGLYRTEFAFSIRSAFPTEEEQYEVLERAAERMHPRKLVLRLVDLGGDKTLAYFPLPPSRNPSLAERGIRLLLRHLDVLKTQLRAFLRVSARHPVSILVPVVIGVEDVRQVREVVRQVQDELSAEGKRFNPAIPIGAMIEVHSAALMARTLAKETDFLSLGTNDLVQYVLAADREDETTAPYYQPLHPV